MINKTYPQDVEVVIALLDFAERLLEKEYDIKEPRCELVSTPDGLRIVERKTGYRLKLALCFNWKTYELHD